jgi:hypothetical protein
VSVRVLWPGLWPLLAAMPPASAQVEPLSQEELQSMRGNFGEVARGESTEREGVLKSEAGRHTIAGGRAAVLTDSKPKVAKSGEAKPDVGPARAGAPPGAPPSAPARGGFNAAPASTNPRDFTGPWNSCLQVSVQVPA